MYRDIADDITQNGSQFKLVVVLVWENPASLRYISQKKKWADYVGIAFELLQYSADVSQERLLTDIQALNEDREVTWYIVQLPLPDHIDTQAVVAAIDPQKDVDGFHPTNLGKIILWDESGLVSCTPAGIMNMLESIDFDPVWKQVTIIGKSNIVWKPLVNLLMCAWATVSSCNSKTPDLWVYTRDADLIVLAAGVPGLLTVPMVSSKAIVIDVWFSVVDGVIHGDADFDSLVDYVAAITPVPGGVGTLTVANLMLNVVKAGKRAQ